MPAYQYRKIEEKTKSKRRRNNNTFPYRLFFYRSYPSLSDEHTGAWFVAVHTD